ncbi:PSD1 and planctomycete cytochrome C domain-containing protein [Novipirellula sp. SH528]|uniref:PSD1 and planctomycete cytochrome C domain-containing protein n=1 Tax=Novipirellula sp. SH528 TaxID=3454466 RepID=UPI003FA0846C
MSRHFQMIRIFSGLLCVLITTSLLYGDGLTPREEFFENQVRPLLIEKCQECHGPELQESDLRLDGLAFVLQGGISGPAAVARNVEESFIIQAVLGQGDFERMPPDEPLSRAEITVLQKWVRMGLPWPASDEPVTPSLGDQVAINKIAETHWAFQPIANPAVPAIEGQWSTWVANPIDAFVIRELIDNDLQPSPAAERSVLVRRLYFDLIGLPPTADEVDAFVRDPKPTNEVVANTIEQLLESNHHGERWARYWLDLARYADTRDWQAQAELRYPYAYTYRDYVIASLNDDKPYDQFLREQIAADFYTDDPAAPQLAALGLLTVGPQFRNNKIEQAADKIDVVCRGLMGITVACARCHDHKYDPVPTEDFYSLYGVFASSKTADDFPVIPTDEPSGPQQADFEKKHAAKQRELAQYKKELRADAVKELRSKLPVYIKGFTMMGLERKLDIRGAISKLKVRDIAMTPLNDSLTSELKSNRWRDDAVLGPWHDGLSISEAEFKKQQSTLLKKWSGDDSLNPRVKQKLKSSTPKTRSELALVYADVFDETLKQWNAFKKSHPDAEGFDDDSLESIRTRLLGAGGWFDLDVEKVASASRLSGKGRKELGDREKAITEVEASHPAAPPRAMTVVDLEKPITPFVMLRGEPNRRGDRVPRQFLSVLSSGKPKPFRNGSGRQELAESIADENNPLTARVYVNRVWERYFGSGLVESLDDFGLRTAPPSHPELLDWLASEFMRNGWSMKWLHQTITSSNTYAQSSDANDRGLQLDPENRLYWRQNRRRLDFEAMRDSMLTVANSLDRTIGGRSVKLSETPYTLRRSIYAYIDRIELDPMLRTFDFASPTASAASRAETTIPQQALFNMNHPFVAELARKVSAIAANESAMDVQVLQIYRQVYSRDPSPQEQSMAKAFLKSSSETAVTQDQVWQYGYGPLVTPDASAEASPTFSPLEFWTGSSYQVSSEFPDPVLKHLRITANGAHPGKNDDLCVIRRWSAPDDGVIQIRGKLKHSRDNGDGVTATIRSKSLAESFTVTNSEAKTDVDRLPVTKGQVVDFVVSPRSSTTADAHIWTIEIQGIDGAIADSDWNSSADFQAPPPPPLTPLAQLAQALMLTNEFLYID